ncbi:hypothetical protein ACFQ9Z_13245 [Streptomyces sp. NPDC056580]|uniref:hypothetical protein n=1 Tax=Streptomyces sp. NPDC056580 TaxID=3345872 RepID=UPI0036950222
MEGRRGTGAGPVAGGGTEGTRTAAAVTGSQCTVMRMGQPVGVGPFVFHVKHAPPVRRHPPATRR